ncbi:DUF721 domain-containing protein [Candidatus Erwinia haradaeae]|uniref:Dna[CI] antecedent, DciA family protein n=1 Tax=Candidatus Erwinia haradaeae TaxID=1922217 RepID=A0A451D2J4_9GAMM|nr:DciA family protein [Candidatus Erwinia haradaeae]VFP79851.1 Dna[CI] antecedent, DciA family protein [Candidatus Erwinia haradaeae]
MRYSHPKLIKNCFNQTQEKGVLQYIYQHTKFLIKVNHLLYETLPETLRPFCNVANFRKGVLIIETANANCLMFLRYEQSNLLTVFQEKVLPSLRSIYMRINPVIAAKNINHFSEHSFNLTERTQIICKPLSKESANLLRIIAQQSPNTLRDILERIASFADDKNQSINNNPI